MIIIVKETPNLILPQKAHKDDAAYDVVATSGPNIVGRKIDDVAYASIDYIEYGTNLFVEPVKKEYGNGVLGPMYRVNYTNYYIDLRPRSSISKYNLMLKNSVGLIDPGYRGELKLRFAYVWQPEDYVTINGRTAGVPNTNKIYKVGDKIAQLLVNPIVPIEFMVSEKLSDSARKEGGFGSSDKKT